MKKYAKTHGLHIMACLFYAVLTCAQQISTSKSELFYSVFPLLTLYYGVLSVPKMHQMYEYNTVEHTTPKWTYFFRMYYHVALLNTVPYAAIIGIFLLLVILMWKDLRFVVVHAEKRLKAIDEAMYSNENTKKYRICHLHLNTFDDDLAARSHVHFFNTNMLHVVPHSLHSEENQNAIKNYVEYRKNHAFPPKNMSEWERKMWNVSIYKNIFLQNRDMYSFVPFIYILCSIVFCLLFSTHGSIPLTSLQVLKVYVNCFLLLGDATGTLLLSKLSVDIMVDFIYMASSAFCLILFTNGS